MEWLVKGEEKRTQLEKPQVLTELEFGPKLLRWQSEIYHDQLCGSQCPEEKTHRYSSVNKAVPNLQALL